jgi:protein-tyrosine phosphatase
MGLPRRELDLDWIGPGLALGAAFPARSASLLVRDHGVRRVVDLRAEACHDALALRRHGILLLELPTEDNCAVAPAMLDRGVGWVSSALDAGDRVLIHCQHGIGRSALLALCVLASRGHDPIEALRTMKRVRPVVSPSPAQLEAFSAFVRGLRAAPPTFEALAAVAYQAEPGIPGA